MPRTKSAKKRLRQSIKRRERNLMYKKRIKLAAKKIKKAMAAGEKNLQSLLDEYYSAVDKAVKAGVIHRNTGMRKKSKMAKKIASYLKVSERR